IVNLERAKRAAFYTAMFPESSLDQVILAAIAMVPDVPEAVYSKSLTDGPVLDFKMKSFVTKRPSSLIFE
ncbi:MAG: hypothetical protein KAG61_01565, partial [Bacteriovoracaceae bacterium]|nr:hypothetical protein [Bacteriovoracaceae bacterium]